MKQAVFPWQLTAVAVMLLVSAGCQGGAPLATPDDAGRTVHTPDKQPAIAENTEEVADQAFQPAVAGKSMRQTPDELADELTVQQNRDRAGSDAAVSAARKALNELDYRKAETLLRRALQLNPGNDDARKELDKVLFILGDRRGEIANVAREEAEREQVRRQQAQVELRRMLVDGERLEQAGRFDEAAKTYEKVLETIEWFHYNIDLSDLKTRAQNRKTLAEDKARQAAADQRRRIEQFAREDAEMQRKRSLTLLKNRVSNLMSKAEQAFDEKRFAEVMDLTERVMNLDRTHKEARAMYREARELRHLYQVTKNRVLTEEEWENTFQSQRESGIPYERIFSFPSREEWNQISRKTVSLAERIVGGETTQERSIKAALREPVDNVQFDDEPFDDVVDFLHTISGINFVLTEEAKTQVEDADEPVRLAAVRGLPLENVLKLVLESRDPKFSYIIKSGAVIIGPAESLQEELFLEFYEVSDITKSPPDFKAPRLALDTEGEDGGGGGSILDIDDDEETGEVAIGPDVLLELLEKSLGDEDGELTGSVQFQSGKLVARTTLENHEKIQKLLVALRKSTGIMVTVESRFIDLQDNFLETIGVDFGNPFTSNLPNQINDIDGVGTQIAPGYEFVDAQGQTNIRSAVFNAFSLPLGTSVAPFQLTDSGGFALQYNVLDSYILEAILEANAKTQEFRKLDAPRVTAFNTQTSHSLIIEQSAYIRDAEVNQTGVIPVINPVIGILNSGSILEVRPTVSHDRKYVILEIRPTLAVQLPSRFQRLILGFTVLDVELPVLNVTRVSTTVTIPDGGTVLVGGVKRTIEEQARVGVPWFSRLPFMDILMGRKGESSLQSNLFVLINAKITVIRDEEAAEFN